MNSEKKPFRSPAERRLARKRALSQNNDKKYKIAILMGDTQSDYTEALLRGFYTCAKEENVDLILQMGPQAPLYCMDILTYGNKGDYYYQFDMIYNYMHYLNPDAIIITYGAMAQFDRGIGRHQYLRKHKDIPILVLEEAIDEPGIPYLLADNYNGMRQVVEHLVVDHGYRKLAFLGGPRNNHDSRERFRAFAAVLHEHNIELTDQMVAYGNYSEQVAPQVNFLLDSNPGLEAIVCANDSMAKSCYQVCNARNLIVGHDIAITGFDDIASARDMDPPLTTVAHSGFQFAYHAIKAAKALCQNNPVETQTMPVTFCKRSSCGCRSSQFMMGGYVPEAQLEPFVIRSIGGMVQDLLNGVPYRKDRNRYGTLILDFFRYVYHNGMKHEDEFNMEYLLNILKQILQYKHITHSVLAEEFTKLLHTLMANAMDDQALRNLDTVLNITQQFIHLQDIAQLEKDYMVSNRRAWFVPFFTKDLANSITPEEARENNLLLMERIKSMGVRSSYIFLFDTPVIHLPEERDITLSPAKLVMYFNKNDMVFFPEEERPTVTEENGFVSFLEYSEPACVASFILFSDEKQYGLMLCEADQEDLSFLQLCSLQLGALIQLTNLNRAEHASRAELKSSMQIIQEQNRVLNFISEYDELTKVLNRRGFMEHALQLCNQNSDCLGILIFADVDHLKEINDCFGHAAGDFAIITAANRLKEVFPEDAIIARIGGDEFIVMLLAESETYISELLEQLKEASNQFNAFSDKPYYVEFSCGVYRFQCEPDVDLNSIIAKSDKLLYKAKANRRKSIKKERIIQAPQD